MTTPARRLTWRREAPAYIDLRMAWLETLHFYSGLSRAFGIGPGAGIAVRRKLGLAKEVATQWRGARVFVRPCESDPMVASHVLGWGEYHLGVAEAALRELATLWRQQGFTPVIVDGGANVGFASLYFAASFPEAVVLAVEPNAASFDLLQRNCANCPQIVPVHAALWSNALGVSLQSARNHSWGDSVKQGGDTPSMRLRELLAGVPNAKPLIIKLDIEGAEREVCSAALDVLRESACLVIEPHDWLHPGGGSLSPVYAALQGREVDTFILGEYLAIIDSKLLRESKSPKSAERKAINGRARPETALAR